MSKSKSSIEADQLCSDAWARFERAVDVVAKSPPQHRAKQPKGCLANAPTPRKKKDPNGYRRYNAESALGASLGGQGKYSEAEPFLLGGYEGMRQLGDKLPESGKARFKRAGERIVQLYESWGKPEKAAAWREKLKGDASYQKVQ